MKKCSKCKEQKELKEFYADKNRPQGHSYKCKKCHRADMKRIREDPDHIPKPRNNYNDPACREIYETILRLEANRLMDKDVKMEAYNELLYQLAGLTQDPKIGYTDESDSLKEKVWTLLGY